MDGLIGGFSVGGGSIRSWARPLIVCGFTRSTKFGTFVAMKRISAYFFATEGGSEPVREWLIGLGNPDKRTIGEDIKAIEFGWP